jgi:hypothetical protein
MFDADVETVRFNIAFDIHTLRFMHNAKPGPYPELCINPALLKLIAMMSS